MLKFSFLICVLLLPASTLPAREWHVSGAGDDTHDGGSPATAFRSLQKAADLVEPGDTVLVGDGIYTNADTSENSAVLRLDRSGTADKWIAWKAAPGAAPEIRPVGWNGIMLSASYNLIEGITITGANDAITLIRALEDGKIKEKDGRKYPGDPKFNTNGIFINGRLREVGQKPHHNVVRHCTVRKCPGGGIVAIETDYVTIEDNMVFDNAWFMRYGGSGITTLNNWAYDDRPGYHVIIQRNLVWNNKANVPWEVVGKLSDGNGINLDVTDQVINGATNPDGDAAIAHATPAPAKAKRPEWKGRALVANNVSAYNGGSGISAFRTKHVDIINNTAFWNGGNVDYANIYSNHSEDVSILNNIIVPRPEGKVTIDFNNTNVRWDYNLYSIPSLLTGEHDIVADPLFVRVHADLREADFRLQNNSPGRDSGTAEQPQATDISGVPRPVGKARDRGAYEQ